MKLVHFWKSQVTNSEDEILKYVYSSMVLMLYDNEKYYIVPLRGMLKYLRDELNETDFTDCDFTCTDDLDSAIETFDSEVTQALSYLDSDGEAPKTNKQEVLRHTDGAFESGQPAVVGYKELNGVSHLIIYIDKDYTVTYSLNHTSDEAYCEYCADYDDIESACENFNEIIAENLNLTEYTEFFKLDELKAEAEKFGIEVE